MTPTPTETSNATITIEADAATQPDNCSNCGLPLTDERPDRHYDGLRRCVGLTSQMGDVYASRGYPGKTPPRESWIHTNETSNA